ncbi:MAG: amidohydrolase family protein, partial [Proteobacteria bacterium]|nr:amidohydrolase family protein [Pseudomonadota bacterium]
HLCEGTYEIYYALEQFGMRPPEFLADIDAFDRHVHCAHSVVLTSDDIDLYAERRPSACHCAFNNYHIGWPQLLVMWRRGLDIGLGTDGAGSWGPMDIFQVAHAARIGQQLVAGTPAHHRNVTTGEELIRVAINGGARALALDAEIGSLEAGKKADIVLVAADDMDQVPVADPLFTIANTVNGRDVQTVVVDGALVMHNRELLTVDLNKIKSKLAARMPVLLERFLKAIGPSD